jgi:serine/threonine protein kinase
MVDRGAKMYDYSQDNNEDGDFNNDQNITEEEYETKEDEEELPLALIVEDEEICQNFLMSMLKEMKIQTRCASSVEEAKKVYWELTKEGISIDIVFLDIYLKDNSTGIQLLKIIKENNWMENALIIVMSGNEDNDIIKECYNYKIQNFIKKPITKASFFNEKFKINRHLEGLKCPLNEYKMEKKLGGGESGIVHLVRNKKTRELFALKTVMLDPNDKVRKKEQEGRVHKNLKSPTIIDLREFKIIDKNLYMVLEYAEGGTLSHHIKEYLEKGEKINTDTILDWVTELFIGLFTIHEKRLMHRDIKSENLFICKKNVLKIGDLGIAKACDYGKTVCGTVFYMAPEIFHYKEYYSTVDIWAAGVVLYELIMLRKPFEGSSTEEIQAKIQSADYEEIPEKTDARLKKLIKLCLNLDPILRYSALEILRLDFIAERVRRLFETKTLVNDKIYKKLTELLDPNKNVQAFTDDQFIKDNKAEENGFSTFASDDLLKLRDYYLKFKLAFKIDSLAFKTHYKAGYFSAVINNVIKGDDMEICASELKIPENDLQKLINDKILINVANPKESDLDFSDKAYYQIKLFENEKIDNSIRFTMGNEPTVIEDAIQLSLECLAQAESLDKSFRQGEESENFDMFKAELLSSQCYVSFLYDIKKLKYLNMSKYSKAEKLSLILNIYQTMYIHMNIKAQISDEGTGNTGLMDSVKSIFRRANKNVEITYEISNQIISLYEMKNIVIRRNKKPLNAYFRLVNDNDPKVNFIEENDSLLLKLHIACLDPLIVSNSESEYPIPLPRITQFKPSTVYDQLDEHCKLWLSDYVYKDENQLNIPKFLKDYVSDFGKDDEDLIKAIFKLNFDPNMKTMNIVKQVKSRELIINYY